MLRTHGPAGIHFKKPSGFPGGFFLVCRIETRGGGGKASGHRPICPDGAWDLERGAQFPLWGESLSRPEGATSRRRWIDVCGGGWGFTRWMDRGVVWSLDRIQRVISFFLIPLLL